MIPAGCYSNGRQSLTHTKDKTMALTSHVRSEDDAMVVSTSNGRYVWRGGTYVEIFGSHASVSFYSDATAVEVINVWDYETDAPREAKTLAGLVKIVKAWESDGDNLTALARSFEEARY